MAVLVLVVLDYAQLSLAQGFSMLVVVVEAVEMVKPLPLLVSVD